MKTIVRGGYVVGFDGTQHEIIRNGVVVFVDDRIVHVGKNYDGPADRTIDAAGALVSPGFINTHAHTGSNAGDYLLTESDKPDFMGSNYLAHVAPLCGHHVAHHLETLDVSVRFSLIHMLKGGTTSVLDYGGAEKGAQDYVDLIEEVGIRCFTGMRHRDADYCFDAAGRQQLDWNEERGAERFNKSIEFAKKFNGAAGGLVTAMLFPGQIDTCTPETLRKTRQATKELGIRTQLHAAMNLLEFNEILRRHRCTPIQLLEKVGFLGPEMSLGHCIFITGHSWIVYPYADDLKIIADSGSCVSYSPLKYMTLGIVMESFDHYREAGITVALGTDTYPKDMVSEMRYAALASRLADRNFTSGHPRDVFNAATLGGAELVGRSDLGRLAKGAKADIVIVGLKNIALGAVRDPIRTLVESATSRDIHTVIVDGQVLVQESKYVRTDEAELVEKVQSCAETVWDAVPSWHWTGKRVDDLIPPSFKMR